MNILKSIKWVFSKKDKMAYATKMDSRSPIYSAFGEKIMNDETVHTITNRILDEYSKLSPKHIRTVDGRLTPVSDNTINNLLKRPNNKMTPADFLRRCGWLREATLNCFIYPTYDLYVNKKTNAKRKVYTGLYPLQPARWEFYEDASKTIYIKFYFNGGKESPYLKYDEVIHWRKNFGEDEFETQPNNSALLRHLILNDKLQQSTFLSIESSLTINGIIKIGTLLDEDKRETYRQNFEDNLKKSGFGVAAIDNSAEYTHIPSSATSISKEILDFFEDKTRRHYGVSKSILDGDFTSEQREAFYETVLEAGITALSQAFTRVMITPFEQSNGNEIVFNTSKVELMSSDKKIRLCEILIPIGALSPNEARSMFGLEQKEGLDEPVQSLNYVKSSLVDKYQLADLLKGKEKSDGKGDDEDGL